MEVDRLKLRETSAKASRKKAVGASSYVGSSRIHCIQASAKVGEDEKGGVGEANTIRCRRDYLWAG
jgi:hypothetical protein